MPRARKTMRSKIGKYERTIRALELRKAGASFTLIGEQMGVTRQRAFEIVSEGMGSLRHEMEERADDVRTLELARLDSMFLSLYPNRANPRVADSLLRLMERRSRLLGLDAPERRQLEGNPERPVEVRAAAFDPSKLDDEALLALKTLLDQGSKPDASIVILPPAPP